MAAAAAREAAVALPDTRSCAGRFVSLESCVAGRYYAAVAGCATDGPQTPSLPALAGQIERFASAGAAVAPEG